MHIHISEGKPEVSYVLSSVYAQYAKDPGPNSQMFLASYTTEQVTAFNNVSRLFTWEIYEPKCLSPFSTNQKVWQIFFNWLKNWQLAEIATAKKL